MELIRSLAAQGRTGPGYVATIGGFDGIHVGHRVLLDRARERAAERGLRSLMVTFEPTPREFFARDRPPARLTSFRERWRILGRCGLDVLCVLRFGARLRALRAAEFAGMLRDAGVRSVVIGHDFRAGHGGEATAEWFAANAADCGFDVEVVPPVCIGTDRVSSMSIRESLAAGDLDRASRLLGRRYSMIGRVVRGQQLGRTLGYPTANLRLSRRRSPTDGIFAVRVHGADAGGEPRPGVASLGTRPTVNGTVPLLEAHLFDWSGDLYGREIEVEFVRRLREERRYPTVGEMVEQIHRDAAEARACLGIGPV
jgi:riboflavin kinase / FMN adenylyltransferase